MSSKKRIEPFNKYTFQYETWFSRNKNVYHSELNAVRIFLPNGEGVEVGVGSGRFAAPLGINLGVDPSVEMMKVAKERGVEVVGGIAEALPFRSSLFDFVLMVTTICFLDNVETALEEAFRIIKSNGSMLVGFIDRESPIGRLYQKHKEENMFYRVASFYTVGEVITHLRKAGFSNFSLAQTVFHPLPEITNIEPVKEGCGEGSFILVKAIK